MDKQAQLPSGRTGWRGRLHEVYSSLDEWEAYSEMYGLAERFGYANPHDAWEDNPLLEGSTNPDDSRKVPE